MDCISVNFLILRLYYSYVKCYHWWDVNYSIGNIVNNIAITMYGAGAVTLNIGDHFVKYMIV